LTGPVVARLTSTRIALPENAEHTKLPQSEVNYRETTALAVMLPAGVWGLGRASGNPSILRKQIIAIIGLSASFS